jgi:predicted dehydrogenase
MNHSAINRRRFFQTAGLGIVAANLRGAAGAKRRIRIGFLGATYSHGPPKIKIAMTSPDWEFVGVCEDSKVGRDTCAKLGAKLISRRELFERAEVVAVESDVPDHAPQALLALKAGKHVHLEKPPALRIDEMREIVAIAREKKLLLQTGFMWRYHPGFNAIIEAVRRGWLGEVFMVRGFISNHLPAERRAEWDDFKGGAMFELGSHLADATVRLLGKPKAVTPFLRRHGKFDDSLKDNNVAVLEYESATAVLMNTALQGSATPHRSFEVLGSNGTAVLQPIEPPMLMVNLMKPAGPYKKGEQKVHLPAYQRYEGDFAELAAAVRGERALSVSLEEELLVAETVLRVSEML